MRCPEGDIRAALIRLHTISLSTGSPVKTRELRRLFNSSKKFSITIKAAFAVSLCEDKTLERDVKRRNVSKWINYTKTEKAE